VDIDKSRLREAAERYAPPGTTRRDVAAVGARLALDVQRHMGDLRTAWRRHRPRAVKHYGMWLANHRSSPSELAAQRRVATGGESAPAVHVAFVVLAGPDQEAHLATTVRALQLQTDPRWSARVAGLTVMTWDDERVGEPIVGDAWSMLADGEADDLVVVLEAGDQLEPDFVFRVAAAAWERPMAAVVHWDDDVIGVDGLVDDPRVKPSWSPDTLLSGNYLGRSFAVRRRHAAGLGDGAHGDDGRWWSLLLSLDVDAEAVVRIPRVLHHLVRRPDPIAGGAALVGRHLARRGIEPGRVLVTDEPGGVRVRWQPEEWPSVAILIPTRHNRPFVERCLGGVARSTYDRVTVRIVDNGPHTPENETWYEDLSQRLGLELDVLWWDEPFNYSRVNNQIAARSTEDVLVFLNDDTLPVDADWLRELAAWAVQPDVGLVGLQLLDNDGAIQHGGVILGLGGFAGHLFQGLRPGDDSLIGSTRWYRNTLSVTAACVAVRRELFERIGGFDERFILCGSDVVLGLDTTFLGLRNVCSPFAEVRHIESATRGSSIPECDFFASFWRYQKWLNSGDPFYSPNLSLTSLQPVLRPVGEPPAIEAVGAQLNRPHRVFRQTNDEAEIAMLASNCRADSTTRPQVEAWHAAVHGPQPVETVNWFLPDLDSPFYGGINTALRIADRLAASHGVKNQFVVMAAANEMFFDSALAAAFPRLAGSDVVFYDGTVDSMQRVAPDADVSIATLWVTAYAVAHFARTRRRFYLIQDFEPMFYPAGSLYALTEEGYRLGLYGLCNTARLRDIYTGRYGGHGFAFMPAVQGDVFHANGRRPLDHEGPARVFLYARPGHWRNCWELAGPALDIVKRRFGSDVHIVTAGSWARPEDLGRGIDHLGLLDYRDTGALYRTCDAGIALTLSEHPSYLPLELLACGVPVVAFDNPAGDWIIEHERNALRCPRTVDGLAEAVSRLVGEADLRSRLSVAGLADIAARHADWDAALAGIHPFLVDPEAVGRG
jgi:GT2 family glycosyltransferase/glycosyltransferase involved in cell wall biosynthesis